MITYIDEEKFFKWYEENCTKPDINHQRVLEELYNQYCETGIQFYVLPKEKTKSGKQEKYAFRYEDLGCCGASTLFIYF